MTEYEQLLDAAWTAHLRPRENGALTVVSTFSGCGGSSLGYRIVGYKPRLAVEWDDHAVATYRLNYPDTPLYHGDIGELSVSSCLDLAGLQPGKLDVLDGSPPCQGFSTAGRRQLDDPRNNLFREYVRLLRGLQPRAFVMENVSGMVKGKMLLVFAEDMRELRSCGYQVSCRLLDAKWFRVPQSRQRVIFIGMRNDLNVQPTHPRAERKPFTVADACPWLRSLEFRTGARGEGWNPYNKQFDLNREPVNTIPKTAARNGEGQQAFPVIGAFTTGWNAGETLDLQNEPAPSVQKSGIAGSASTQFGVTAELGDGPVGYLPAPPMAGKTARVARSLQPGQNGSSSPHVRVGTWHSLVKLHTDRPAATVTKQGSFGGQPRLIAPQNLRGLSIGEVRRLCSFPDQFQFPESGKPRKDWELAWARLGNSVPPFLMRAIAAHIKTILPAR